MIIRRAQPDVVLGFGGFASFPGGLMGTAAGKPLVLHDSNAVAGLANRVLALRRRPDPARLSAGAARHATRSVVEWVGNPLRDEICALPPPDAALRRAAAVRCACSSSAAASARRR